VLVDTFVGYWLPAFTRDPKRRLLKTSRFLFFDVGVRNASAGLPLVTSMLATEGAALFEQWVGLELIARAAHLGRSYRVSYWRTRGGAEVDFIWEAPDEDVAIEVKWTERPQPSDARHIESFMRENPSRAKRGVVICRVAEPQQLTATVTAVPWNAF
jgi:predicted AAA+ superfamily ATPase